MESLKELYAAGASRRRVARVGQASWHEVGEQLARAFGSRACDGFPEFTNHVRTLLRRSSLDLAMTVDCVHLYPAPRLGKQVAIYTVGTGKRVSRLLRCKRSFEERILSGSNARV